MSFRHRPTDFEVQEIELLGAKISDKHQEYREWARLDPDIAFIIWFLEHPEASLKDMLTTYGYLEFLKYTTEITRLSMIVGRESGRANVKEEVERLRAAVSDT